MRVDLAASDTVLVPIPDGGELKVLRLAGHAGPVVLFLHANGFHIKCYTPLVSQTSPALACQHNGWSRYRDPARTGMSSSKRRFPMLGS